MIFSRSLVPLTASLLLSLVSTVFAAPVAAPNVVVITIDTLRADHVGCYGYKQIHTPNIDALAADGAVVKRLPLTPGNVRELMRAATQVVAS